MLRLGLVLAVGSMAVAGCGSGGSTVTQGQGSFGGQSVVANTTTAPTQPTGFCASHDCIPSFASGRGSIIECADHEWSHSGGLRGACSGHGGELNVAMSTPDPAPSSVSSPPAPGAVTPSPSPPPEITTTATGETTSTSAASTTTSATSSSGSGGGSGGAGLSGGGSGGTDVGGNGNGNGQ